MGLPDRSRRIVALMNRSFLAIVFALLGGATMIVLFLVVGRSNAIASGQTQAPAQAPQWGTDIQVNPTPTGTPYHPVQINYSMVIKPTDENKIIAGWDSYEYGDRSSAYASSTDQGLTWSGGR